MNEFLSRQPFAILGSIGILGIVSNFVALASHLQMIVDAWQAIVRPITDALFGWLFKGMNDSNKAALLDYLAMGLIVSAGAFRAFWHSSKGKTLAQRAEAFLAIVLVTAWPIILPMSLYVVATPSKHSREERLECMIILESLVYALIALGISYAFLLTA